MKKKLRKSVAVKERDYSISELADALYNVVPGLREAYTQADIELTLDDKGWLVGGQKVASELDPISRTATINKCRFYWLRDPLVHQAVRLWTDYSLGGTAISYQADDDAVQKKLDVWMKDRRNRALLSTSGIKRLSTKLLVDGEIFFALFDDGVVRTFDPLQITDIITDPDDDETILAYKRESKDGRTVYFYQDWAATDEQLTSAEKTDDPTTRKKIKLEQKVKVYHWKFDTMGKRGIGLLVTAINWSREHRRFMEARVAITQALANFAYKLTAKVGQKGLDKIKAKLQSTFVAGGLTGGTEKNPQAAPGSSWIQNEGSDLVPMPRTTGATEARDDSDGLKLMVSAGTGIMLHYFGDPSTGNLATATAMELPMLKQFQGYQQLIKDTFRDLFSIVLDEEPDKEPVPIDIDLPPILDSDLTQVGDYITKIAAVFPEVKIPEVLEMLLIAFEVTNVDEIMKKIDKNKAKLDKAAAELAAKPPAGTPALPPAPTQLALQGSEEVVEAINKLVKVLEAPIDNAPLRAQLSEDTTRIGEGPQISAHTHLELGPKKVKKTGTAERQSDGTFKFVVNEERDYGIESENVQRSS